MLDSILKSIPAVSECILSVSALLSLLLSLFRKKKVESNTVVTITLMLLFLCILLCFSNKSEQFFWNGLFIHIPFSVYSKIILYSVSIIALSFLFFFLRDYKIKQFEWIFVAIFSIIGGSVALSSNHFLTLFIGLEISNLSQYILVSANKDNQQNNEVAVKFFTISLISTSFMLFGMSLIYGFTGTNFFNALYYFFENYTNNFEQAGAILGMFFVIMGLCFKLPVVPFHTWVQDIYQVVPLPVILFVASVPKIIAIFSLLHLLTYPFHGAFFYWRYLLVAFSVVSMIWGSLAAICQQNLKRMLAYSSISDMGFLLIGPSMGGGFGLSSAIIYIIFYVLSIIGIFALLTVFEKNSYHIKDIHDLSGIIDNMPILGGIFCFLILSLAGIPPFPGFFAKVYILESMINRSAYFLGILSILIAVVNAAYYLNVLNFFVLKSTIINVNRIGLSEKLFIKILIAFIAIFLLIMVLFPFKLLEITQAVAVSVLF